jgi:hypothetical protein
MCTCFPHPAYPGDARQIVCVGAHSQAPVTRRQGLEARRSLPSFYWRSELRRHRRALFSSPSIVGQQGESDKLALVAVFYLIAMISDLILPTRQSEEASQLGARLHYAVVKVLQTAQGRHTSHVQCT